jgi:thermitase
MLGSRPPTTPRPAPTPVQPAPKPAPTPAPKPNPAPTPTVPISGSNDPHYSAQWGLHKTLATQAWQRQLGQRKIRVAVIDTGVDMFHRDLLCNLEDGYNAIKPGDSPQDTHGHGTHVAGTVGACTNNGIGVAGVAQVSIVPIKASANGSFLNSDIIRGINWAVQEGVDVINMSFGGPGNSTFLRDALKAASDRGILLVAAAGNENANNDTVSSYPANYALATMISVASSDSNDGISSFSNFGRNSVHIAAPGSNIISTTVGGGYGYKSGTSMAAPFIAGSLGLLLSHRPRFTGVEAKARLLRAVSSTSRKATITNGRVDLNRLLQD